MDENKQVDIETLKLHRAFKKDILDVVFNHCDTFYIHCMPHPDLVIGQRGLKDKETEEGIIFVFGPHSNRNLSWDERYIFCDLQFSTWEAVSIPYECIVRVFDKSGQVIMQWATLHGPENEMSDPVSPVDTNEKNKELDLVQEGDPDSRVIEVDFRKGKH